MLRNPDSLKMWLKFDSGSAICDSACSETQFQICGNPTKLPQNRGIYRNWGYFFKEDDAIIVKDGLKICGE
jgi:hypothetical protein